MGIQKKINDLIEFSSAWLVRLLPRHIPVSIKLSIIISTLVTVGMSLLGTVVITNQTNLMHSQINTYGQTVALQLANSAKELILNGESLGLSILTRDLSANENIHGTAVLDNNGKLLSAAGNIPPLKRISDVSKNDIFSRESITSYQWSARSETNSGRVPYISFIAPVNTHDLTAGYVIVTFSHASLEIAIRDTIRSIIAATILMIALAIVISFIMSQRLSRPIHHLMTASKAIGQGNLDYRISERRNDEIGFLMSEFNKMADGLLQKSQVENAFSRYVDKNIAQKILNDIDNVELGGQHKTGSVLFADIVGYTSISEKISPEETADMLNEYFTYIEKASKLYNGTIDKYMGDCAMLVFGIPEYDERHAFNAIACALLIKKIVTQLNKQRLADGKFAVDFRFGINSGEMLAGNMGSTNRMEFTVVGDTVNLASRLCAYSEPGEIIISSHLVNDEYIKQNIELVEYKPIHLRSKEYPIATYQVLDVADSYQHSMQQEVKNILNKDVAA